jgi:uncharacterized caspase-like protein
LSQRADKPHGNLEVTGFPGDVFKDLDKVGSVPTAACAAVAPLEAFLGEFGGLGLQGSVNVAFRGLVALGE